MDQEITRSEEFDDFLVRLEELRGDGVRVALIPQKHFVICRIAINLSPYMDFEAEGSTWMVGIVGVDSDIPDRNWMAITEIIEGDLGSDILKADGEVGIGEHVGKELTRRLFKADGGPNNDLHIGIVDWIEKGESSHVIPVSMAQKNVDGFS